MASEILLSSEAYIKNVTNISDNIAGKYILAALRDAQEIGLKGILGENLLDAAKALVESGDITSSDYSAYKDLVDECQLYLAYMTAVEVTNRVSYKIGNFGVAKSTDENLQVATFEEIAKMQYYYQSKADAYCLQLQNWLLENRVSFDELTDCQCHKIESNLYSAASCGIWLGGARGKGRAWSPYGRRKGGRR